MGPEIMGLIAKRSTPEEWSAQADKFFEAENYEAAKQSYERAGNVYKAKHSQVGWIRGTSCLVQAYTTSAGVVIHPNIII
eukprot:1157770-Pelagomonas_calceolata.AAC.1